MTADPIDSTPYAGSAFADRRPRLLVVDDQPINIQALYQAFSADHQVFMAKSGEQALQMCAQHAPDLVLLDIMMPGMDGHEVCRRLKSNPATADIPVIFVTAHGEAAAEAEGLDVGAVDFITKPIHPRVVRARVRTHLTLKAQADLLRRWVYIDGLTQIHNRRHFDELLLVEWARAARAGTSLSVVMIDVDFFKRFNDHYGHQAGDDCLRQVAAALRSGLRRPGDLLARYGGEEFVCLLPDTTLAGALELATRLGERIGALQLPHAESAAAAHVTVSLGVGCKGKGEGGSAADLVRDADAQLYMAKSRGRNRACGGALKPD
ncbi:MAG: diguanylate cyclase [Rubrivivax sp.]|nr:diguanylate cyclase [Rubrivivax sp.]MDP3082148.1 diguanylate cyclase [Rubrivivax sp.]